MKKQIVRLTESDLHKLIKESVTKILKETSLYADDPYFAQDYLMPDDDDIRSEYPEGKEGDMDYDWDTVADQRTPQQTEYQHDLMNKIATSRKMRQDWSPRQLRSAEKMKHKWINGERDLDDLDDAHYGASL